MTANTTRLLQSYAVYHMTDSNNRILQRGSHCLFAKRSCSCALNTQPIAYIESSGTVSYKDVVKFACKHTGMQSTVMKAAIDSCCQTIEHFLSMGHRVQLGELGSFFITTDSNAVYSNTEAGICQLKKLNIRFDAKKDLKEAINNAERELAGIYKIVDHERKIYEKVGTKESDGKNESGNNSNGNSGGDSNNGNNSDSGGGFAG